MYSRVTVQGNCILPSNLDARHQTIEECWKQDFAKRGPSKNPSFSSKLLQYPIIISSRHAHHSYFNTSMARCFIPTSSLVVEIVLSKHTSTSQAVPSSLDRPESDYIPALPSSANHESPRVSSIASHHENYINQGHKGIPSQPFSTSSSTLFLLFSLSGSTFVVPPKCTTTP